jgi:hypothetical protein
MKLSSILPLIRRFAPVDDCSPSPNLFTQRHSKTLAGGLRFRSPKSSRVTVQQTYFVFRESACSSPSAPNNRQRHTNPALSAKLSRPVICSLARRRHVSGRAVSSDASAGLYNHADQWRLLFEKSAMGAGGPAMKQSAGNPQVSASPRTVCGAHLNQRKAPAREEPGQVGGLAFENLPVSKAIMWRVDSLWMPRRSTLRCRS